MLWLLFGYRADQYETKTELYHVTCTSTSRSVLMNDLFSLPIVAQLFVCCSWLSLQICKEANNHLRCWLGIEYREKNKLCCCSVQADFKDNFRQVKHFMNIQLKLIKLLNQEYISNILARVVSKSWREGQFGICRLCSIAGDQRVARLLV